MFSGVCVKQADTLIRDNARIYSTARNCIISFVRCPELLKNVFVDRVESRDSSSGLKISNRLNINTYQTIASSSFVTSKYTLWMCALVVHTGIDVYGKELPRNHKLVTNGNVNQLGRMVRL